MKILYLTATPTYVVMDEADASGNDEKKYPKLDLWPELREITDVLFEARSEGFVDLEIVPEVRTEDLARYLSRRKVNVLHFSGHGDRTDKMDDEGNEEANLIWQGDYGSGEYVSNTWLKKEIEKHDIKILVLNCCWSEQVAESLRGTVSLVIGTTCPLRSDSAAEFSRVFYDNLQKGIPLSEVLTAVKKVVGDQLYVYKERDDKVWDEVIPPQSKEEKTPAKAVLSIQARLERVYAQLPSSMPADLAALIVAFIIAFVAFSYLDSLSCANTGNCDSPVTTCVTDCNSAPTCKLCKPTTCADQGTCEDGDPWPQFVVFLEEMLETSEWLKFEPFAILMMFAAGPASRLVAGFGILLATPVGRKVLPIVGAQTQERLASEIAQGRIGNVSAWLSEFEK